MSRPSPTTSPPPALLPDLPLLVEQTGGPQTERLHRSLRDAILTGRLAPGLRLPASRALAKQLGMRRNTVISAYERLLSDGLIETRVGAGSYVAAHVPAGAAPPGPLPPEPPAAAPSVFALGQTRVDALFEGQFRRAVTNRLRRIDPVHLGYGDPRGGRELREQVAEYLRVGRGIACDPGRIVLVGGTQHGLRLCLGAILRPGDAAWMEDPGYPAARRSLLAAGARVVPVPVDEHGLDVAEGRRRAPQARAAYVTPSHQFPTGVAMKLPRRLALLDWARAADAWILEDDYDSEYRYAGPPLTALAGMDAARRVIYIGTLSKILFPGLRLGFVVLPPPLHDAVLAARAAVDRFPPSLLEGAIADLMAGGELAAHVRRMRARYRAARDAVAETLTTHAHGALRVAVPDQGLHLVAYLGPGVPQAAAGAIRAAAKETAWLLSETRMQPEGAEGFVLGFSGHDLATLRDAARRLAQAAAAVAAGTSAAGT